MITTRRTSLMLFAGLLAGCAVPKEDGLDIGLTNPDLDPLAFPAAPLRLRVEEVITVLRPRVDERDDPIDADFPLRLERIAREWGAARLVAAGGPYEASYEIDRATAYADPLPGGGEQVTAAIRARLLIRGARGTVFGWAGAETEGGGRSSGPLNPVERAEFLNEIAMDLSAEFDRRMTAAIESRLGAYMVA